MAVITTTRRILRGVVRAQLKYAILLCLRLIRDYGKNNGLLLFADGDGPGSVTAMQAIISQWAFALLSLS
jgi:hypothetical protein